jgi:hypothetical protein
VAVMLKTARLRKDKRTKKKWKNEKRRKLGILKDAKESGRYKDIVKKKK